MVAKHLLMGMAAFSIATAANAQSSIIDPAGDFLASYSGPHQADLDITSLSVSYNPGTMDFLIQSTFAGAIDPSLPGFYVIGANTGTGTGPFGSIGAPDVKFNKVILVQKNGTATLGGTPLAPGSVTIGGNALSLIVPLSLLPSTGFSPGRYGFSIWPRSGAGGLEVISDFAPNNATLAAVPEPAAWSLMLGGFGIVGGALRRRRMSLSFA